ncbi:hypothetical protein [Nonomuraea sp. NPDC001023]
MLNLAAQAGDGAVIISWGLPVDDGSSAMLDAHPYDTQAPP